MKLIPFNFIIYLLLIANFAIAQNQSMVWIVGYDNNALVNPKHGIVELTFNANTSLQKYFSNSNYSKTDLINTSICNAKGELILFTEGLNLYGTDFSIIENGDGLNPGKVRDDFSPEFYPVAYSHILLPYPGSSDYYRLLHISISYNPNPSDPYRSVVGDKFLMTTIKKNQVSNKYRVESKNELILAENLHKSHMAYCRHANGRDWWLVIEKYGLNRHYIYLIDPTGIHLHATQDIGKHGGIYDWSGNSIFSPDGTKFIKYSFDYGIQVFDFDRCTGKLSNAKQFPTYVNPSFKEASIAVSPNSRYLYINDYSRIWQYDLYESEKNAFVDTVGHWDGYFYRDLFTTGFYQMALANDGKIYLSCHSGNIYLHVINHPNERGLSSNVELRKIELEAWMVGGLPIMPNYALGPVINSECDSLSQWSNHDWTKTIKLYPNPITDELYLSSTDSSYFPELYLELFDFNGKQVRSFQSAHNQLNHKISLVDLPAAWYCLRISDLKGKSISKNLIKI